MAVTHTTGRGPEPDPAPSRWLPSRRPGITWPRPATVVTDGEVVTYGVLILTPDGQPLRVLTGWPTVRDADQFARDRTGDYRVVPLEQVHRP
ncbi:hypothetical protein FRAAL2946 [Frankia alni ACN14a]|uniref:Uncharacterized protein n=1 Tax=Frankia alni (strain DSM 45986 / CECT 9034 / ACN14a) TaxID=326424 RepID=Q0RLL4_FRAAA|nr:hypothetical protein FRAAL2946 [Frankia alni ACN14a]